MAGAWRARREEADKGRGPRQPATHGLGALESGLPQGSGRQRRWGDPAGTPVLFPLSCDVLYFTNPHNNQGNSEARSPF